MLGPFGGGATLAKQPLSDPIGRYCSRQIVSRQDHLRALLIATRIGVRARPSSPETGGINVPSVRNGCDTLIGSSTVPWVLFAH